MSETGPDLSIRDTVEMIKAVKKVEPSSSAPTEEDINTYSGTAKELSQSYDENLPKIKNNIYTAAEQPLYSPVGNETVRTAADAYNFGRQPLEAPDSSINIPKEPLSKEAQEFVDRAKEYRDRTKKMN